MDVDKRIRSLLILLVPKFQALQPGSLLIRNVTADDALRNYTCKAKDIHSPKPDKKEMEIKLKVQSKTFSLTSVREEKVPPAPISKVEAFGVDKMAVRVMSEHETSGDSDALAEADLNITRYIVQYKMLNGGDWVTPYVNRTTDGFILRGRLPNMTYIIRAASQNRVGTGDFSQDLQFTTVSRLLSDNEMNLVQRGFRFADQFSAITKLTSLVCDFVHLFMARV